jgi:hypothetical protein
MNFERQETDRHFRTTTSRQALRFKFFNVVLGRSLSA